MAFTKWGPYTHLHLVWALIPIKPRTQWAFTLQVMCSSALIHLLLHPSSNTMWTTAGNYLLGNLSLVIVSFHSLDMHLAWLALIHWLLHPNPTRTTTAARNYLLGNLSPLIVSVHSLDMHLAWLGPVPQSTIVGGGGGFPVWICFLTIVPSSPPSLANKQTKNLKEKKTKKKHTHTLWLWFQVISGALQQQMIVLTPARRRHHPPTATRAPTIPFLLLKSLSDGLCASRNSSDSGTQALKRVSVVGCCPHWVRRTDGRTTAPPSSINDQSGSFKTPISPPPLLSPPSPPSHQAPPYLNQRWAGAQLEAD
jgi:hypothetical protein